LSWTVGTEDRDKASRLKGDRYLILREDQAGAKLTGFICGVEGAGRFSILRDESGNKYQRLN